MPNKVSGISGKRILFIHHSTGGNLIKEGQLREEINSLQSKEFLQGISNIHIFDFFSQLSDENGFLKKEFTRFLPWDSHPNKKANETISPLFADYLVKITKNR